MPSAFVDTGDGTKKMDPMLSCRVVVIKWVAQYTHITRNGAANGSALMAGGGSSHNVSATSVGNLSHSAEDGDQSGKK